MKKLNNILAVLSILLISACVGLPPPAPSGGGNTPPVAPSDTPPAAEEDAISYPPPVEPTEAQEGYPAPDFPIDPGGYPAPGAGEGYPAPGSTDCQIQAADPQPHSFSTEDGLTLSGTFYPSSSCNAPIVLLFHQFGSQKDSWTDLAIWLQNRSGENASSSGGWLASPLQQYDWFPEMPADLSLAVFAIDFRGHGDSPSDDSGFDPAGFLLDAEAALAYAKSLPFVDPQRILTIGASIGADASVDVCLKLNGPGISDFQENKGCIGALSLSPGNFLDVSYTEVVTRLGDAPFNVLIRCIATELDGEAPTLCSLEQGPYFMGSVYPDRSEHGIAMLRSDLDPNIGGLILDFVLSALKR